MTHLEQHHVPPRERGPRGVLGVAGRVVTRGVPRAAPRGLQHADDATGGGDHGHNQHAEAAAGGRRDLNSKGKVKSSVVLMCLCCEANHLKFNGLTHVMPGNPQP